MNLRALVFSLAKKNNSRGHVLIFQVKKKLTGKNKMAKFTKVLHKVTMQNYMILRIGD